MVTGVETAEQFAWFSTLPDIEVQGFYIGAPLEKDQVGDVIFRHGGIAEM